MADGDVLTDVDEELLRQMHPSWRHNGAITSQLFKPTPKDDGKPSLDRGAKISYQESHAAHTAMGLTTEGTYAVTVGEVGACALTAIDNPVEAKPAHAYIDMSGLSKSELSAATGFLKDCAVERGCLYPT